MKLLTIGIIIYLLLVVGCASVKPQVPIQDITNLEPVITAQTQTWCCCKVSDGSVCCNWTRFCPEYIPGCYCAW